MNWAGGQEEEEEQEKIKFTNAMSLLLLFLLLLTCVISIFTCIVINLLSLKASFLSASLSSSLLLQNDVLKQLPRKHALQLRLV